MREGEAESHGKHMNPTVFALGKFSPPASKVFLAAQRLRCLQGMDWKVHLPLDHHTLLSHPPELIFPKPVRECAKRMQLHHLELITRTIIGIKEKNFPSYYLPNNCSFLQINGQRLVWLAGRGWGRACSCAHRQAPNSTAIVRYSPIKHTQNAANGLVFL